MDFLPLTIKVSDIYLSNLLRIDNDIDHMCGIHAIGGLSSHKNCYIGTWVAWVNIGVVRIDLRVRNAFFYIAAKI